MKHLTSRRLAWLLCAAAGLSFTTARAQLAADSATATGEADDETIVLSPFEVRSEADRGYVATNTLAGSRINTSLVDTPASISVMTSEFLSDIGALDLRGAMEYAVGAGNHAGDVTGNGLIQNAFNIQIRGYRDTTITRNYFTTDIPGDTFNMDRIDVARGPNSILFGIGGPGGVVNITSKQARTDRMFGAVNLVVGDWGMRRAGVDFNQPLLDNKVGVRVNLMSQRADGYYEFEEDDQDRAAFDAVWRATRNTTVRLNGEFGDLHQNRARPFLPYDATLSWKVWGRHHVAYGTPQAPGSVPDDDYYSQFNGAPPDPVTGWPQNRTAGHIIGNKHQDGWLAIMDGPLAGKVIYAGTGGEGTRWYRTSGSENQTGFNTPPQFDDERVFPRWGNIAGPGQFTDTRYSTMGLTVEQRIGEDLNIEFAANRAKTSGYRQQVQGYGQNYIFFDVVTTLPTFDTAGLYQGTIGSDAGAALAEKMGIPYVPTEQGRNALNLASPIANPNVGKLMAYADPSYNDWESESEDLRLSASYHLDLGRFGDHMLLAVLSRNESEWENENFAFGNIHPDRVNPYHFRGVLPLVYHIDPFSPNEAERGIRNPFGRDNPIFTPQTVTGLPSGSPFGGAFQGGFVRDDWNWGRSINESGTLATQSRFFDNSIVLTGGLRRDNIRSWAGDDLLTTDEETGAVTGVTRNSRPTLDVSENTYTLGTVLRWPGVEWVSVFGNLSTNFRGQGDVELFEDEALRPTRKLGPLTGRGRDFGLKFNLLENRVNATITRFEVSQDGANAGSLDGNVSNYINAIWTTLLNGGPDTVVTDEDDPNGHHFGGVDTRSQKSEGYEFELTANPTPNWRVSFNISKTENTVSNVGGALSTYVEKHRSTWAAQSGLAYDASRSPGNLSNAGGTNNIGALITGLEEILGYAQSEEGQIEVNNRPWNANAYTAYDFTTGPLNGLTIGAGMNYRGDAILGVKPAASPNEKSQMFKGGDYYLFNAMIGYEFKLRSRYTVRLQLNVDNLLDNDDRQILASAWNPNANDLETQYYYFRPRNYRLTATLKF